jgi:carboxylesterase type B
MRFFPILKLLLIVLAVAAQAENGNGNGNSESKIYNLTSGLFEAKRVRVLDRYVDRLLGIPYAEITGQFERAREYRRPSSKTNERVVFANKWGPMCIQPAIFHNIFYGNFKLPHEFDMSFNCLTLNVFISKSSSTSTRRENGRGNLTAMFFIHGGSNAAGAASFMDGSGLAALGDVIVVMPNYRLDVMGFFNVQKSLYRRKTDPSDHHDDHLGGNYGLWDQVMALKWLHANCDRLGCDPKSITVFGHSAGSSDTLLLALARQAQPYINRIIMQSGSGLAHWSHLYETYLLEKLAELKPRSLQDELDLLDAVDFKKSKYIFSLNDTFNNFLTYTTCNLTHKHQCVKKKIANFPKFTQTVRSGQSATDARFVALITKLTESLDINEFLYLFGYLNKLLVDSFSRSDVKAILEFDDQLLNVTSPTAGRWFNFDHLNKRIKSVTETLANETTSSSASTSTKASVSGNINNKTSCHTDLVLFISNEDTLALICDNFKKYEHDLVSFFNNTIIRYFLSCFGEYQHQDSSNDPDSDGLSYLLNQNSPLILQEMQACYDKATRLTLLPNETLSVYDREFVENALQEVSYLTENSNYLHRPSVDGELIERMPHVDMSQSEFLNGQIDVLIGVTSHESFYFLLHDYNINDLLVHTFVYSSLLNLTTNLVQKLARLKANVPLNFCVKRGLFAHYNITLNDTELSLNKLKSNLNSLDLISDYDFVLPMISQLNAYLNFTKQRSKGSRNKLFAYEYSHLTSFNYLLDHLKTYHLGYENALAKLNFSVIPHFSELDYVFGMPVLSRSNLVRTKNNYKYAYNYTREEYEFSLLIVDYWTNFAKYG